MKRQIKWSLVIVFACILYFHSNIAEVKAKDVTPSEVSYTIEVAEKEDEKAKTSAKTEEVTKNKGKERAEELSKMPLSGKSPMAYVGLIGVSVFALAIMISLGKAAKKKNKFL